MEYRFGPHHAGEGVRYRLWAPSASSVDLVIDDGAAVAMRHTDDGWYESRRFDHAAGTRYAFRINGEHVVPDPAARVQAADVHGPSLLCAPPPALDPAWRGRPWHESVISEIHVGTFTAEGTFRAAAGRLRELADSGITAIELMPIADFSGARNWGYDGVLPFAPDRVYGTPEDLRALIDAAHALQMSVYLDVVYNHFGPEGNYLGLYAPQFFTDRVSTPWGAAIDFDRDPVRSFFIENACYWLNEIGFDGLRLDAVHAIHDRRRPDIVSEIAATVHRERAARGLQPAHLILENERNESHYLPPYADRSRAATAQWNDDIHHIFHVLATGESFGYYHDFAAAAEPLLARAMSTGFAFQGQPAGGSPRGEPSERCRPTAFISFLQNHDQIGNRAFGERLTALADPPVVAALQAAQLLLPQVPMLFMGEEWLTRTPFRYFCDYSGDLAEAVRRGRRREFDLDEIPDPIARETAEAGRLDWDERTRAEHAAALARTRHLLALRRRWLIPVLPRIAAGTATGGGESALAVRWPVEDAAAGNGHAPGGAGGADGLAPRVTGWVMWLNLSDRARPLPPREPADGTMLRPVFRTDDGEHSDPGGAAGRFNGRAAAADGADNEPGQPLDRPATMAAWSVRVAREEAR